LGWIVSRNLQIDYRYGRALVNRSSRFWRDSAPDNTPDLLEARALLKSRESERLSRRRSVFRTDCDRRDRWAMICSINLRLRACHAWAQASAQWSPPAGACGSPRKLPRCLPPCRLAPGATFISFNRARTSGVRHGKYATGVKSGAWSLPTSIPE